MARIIATETEQMQKAYMFYLNLGRNRNVAEVAHMFNKATRTIQSWKSYFDWEGRIRRYLEEHNNTFPTGEVIPDYHTMVMEAPEDPDDEIDTPIGTFSRLQYRRVIGAMMQEFITDLEEGKIKINSIYEFEKVAKLDLLLMGEATSKVAIDTNGNDININSPDNTQNILNVIGNNPVAQDLVQELWRQYNAKHGTPQPQLQPAPSSGQPIQPASSSGADIIDVDFSTRTSESRIGESRGNTGTAR